MASARERLERSQALRAGGQAQEALAQAKDALAGFKVQGDQAGAAEALRHVVGGQVDLLEVTPDEAQSAVKELAATVKKSAPEGRLADALIHMAAAEVHLFKGESGMALKAASEAANALVKEGSEPRHESEAFQMVVNAQLMRSNAPKALAAANSALAAAQRSGEKGAEGAAWLAVATARHASGGQDAQEAARRAADTFRDAGDKANGAAAATLLAQIELAAGDHQAAASAARDALALAKDTSNGPQAAAAAEPLAEALIAGGQPTEALREAEGALTFVEGVAASRPASGVAAAMSAVLLAHTACKGIDSAVALVRKYVVQLRERGDRRGEVKMLHRLSTMSQVPPDALNSGQAALALATEIGDGVQEAAIKSTVTDLYVAMGKTDKAPNRKPAMKALGELVKAFEAQDKDRFQDAAKYMDGFYNALKQEDIELAITRVISKDPPTYMAFLEANGEQVADQKPVATTGQTAKTVLHEMMYFGFSSGGISYGPRYRPNRISTKRFNSTTRTISVLQLNDQSDQWERELGYNPSMLDGTLQHTAAAGYYPD